MSRQAGKETGWLEAGRLEAGWLEAGRLEPWEPWLHWYCTGEAVGVLASLVLLWGGYGSPGFAGTALGGLWEPWLCWYCTGGAVGALALLVLHWGAVGALALLVLHWGAVGALGLSGGVEITLQSKQSLRNKFLKFPECSKHSKHLEISFCSFLAVPNIANT